MLACKAVLAYGATNSIERSSVLRSEILLARRELRISNGAVRGTYSRD